MRGYSPRTLGKGLRPLHPKLKKCECGSFIANIRAFSVVMQWYKLLRES